MLTSFTALDHRKLAHIDKATGSVDQLEKTRFSFSMLPHRIAARNAR
ncbi:hypothetical protein [Fulvimarina endophytica]|nr:hypothetical protein [Fulvimarina endophytica]